MYDSFKTHISQRVFVAVATFLVVIVGCRKTREPSIHDVTPTSGVTFDWATVGELGNEPDSSGFGAVNYTYQISKHEVTNAQYTEFLNAVDPAGDNHHSLYNSLMARIPDSGIDRDEGAAAGSKYKPKKNRANKPVTYVTFFDAMRFVNWLENGQGRGATESGSYSISDGLSETRALSATYFLPTENEWYKAAYYDPRAEADGGPPGDGHYWLYPTGSNIASKQEVPPGSKNRANFNIAADGTTEVGGYRKTTSFYGTFDQGGNVWEWDEAVVSKRRLKFLGLRGGSWDRGAVRFLSSSVRDNGEPEDVLDDIGIRVARKAIRRGTSHELGLRHRMDQSVVD